MLKKTICLMLIVLIGISIFAGCGTPQSSSPAASAPGEAVAEKTGRYAATELSLPEGIAIPAKHRTYFQRNPQGDFQLFYSVESSQNGPYQCATLQKDGSWLVEEALAVNDALAQKPDQRIYAVLYGNDGELYVVLCSAGAPFTISVFHCAQGRAEPLLLEGLEEDGDIINGAAVLSDGSVLLCRSQIQRYEMSSGEIAAEYPVHTPVFCVAGDDTLYYYTYQDNMEKTNVLTAQTLPDGEAFRLPKLQSDSLDQLPVIFSDGEGGLLCCNNGTIRYLAPNATLWEEIISAQYDVFRYPTFQFEQLYKDGDAYLAQVMYEGEIHIIRIAYDPNALLEEKTLIVAGMDAESDIMQNAIAIFQREHPGVLVQYRQMVGENAYASSTDARKALNTEILAGEGPDILLLDHKTMEQYRQKGVLLPLQESLQELKSALLPGIWIGSMDENKNIWGLPTAFHAWALLADSETAKAFESLHTLADYAKKQQTPLLPAEDWTQYSLVRAMLQLYRDEFYAKDGSVDSAKAESFLKNVKAIADQIGCTEWEDDPDASFSETRWPRADRGGAQMVQQKALASLSRQQAPFEKFSMALIRLHTAASYNPQAKLHIVQNAYQPDALISISANCKEPQLAAQFLSLLLRVPAEHSGSIHRETGTAVAQKALENAADEVEASCENMNQFGAFAEPVFPDYTGYTLKPAVREDVQPILELFCAVNTPVYEDAAVLDILMPQVKAYFAGQVSAKEAAESMQKKAALLIAEQ